MAKVIDLDALLGLTPPDAPKYLKSIKMLGREWTVVCDVNQFAVTALASGEAKGIMRLMESLILPEQWEDFQDAMARVPGLTAEQLIDIVTKLMEVAAERPTTPPSGSSVTSRKRTSSRS